MISKKKVFADIRRLFLAEITNLNVFFRPKTGDLQKKGLRRNPTAFSGRNHKLKHFFRPKPGDLQKKKVFAEIRTLFLAKITNSHGFSSQKQQLFPAKKIPWGARNKSGGGGKNENRGEQCPPAPPLATRLGGSPYSVMCVCIGSYNSRDLFIFKVM